MPRFGDLLRAGRLMVLAAAALGLGLSLLAGLGLWRGEAGHGALSLALLLAAGAAGLRQVRKAAFPAVFGSARFARPGETPDGGPDGLLLGRELGGAAAPLRYAGEGHLITIAPTRSGKGVGAVVPNLLTTPRGVLCVDPKGENARIAARARGRFGRVHVLDPFGISGQAGSAYNPLAGLGPEDADLAERAGALAEAMVHDAPERAGEAHWGEEAKALIAGIILQVVTDPLETNRTLVRVREHLTLAPTDFTDLLEAMQTNPAAGGLVARAANRQLSKNDREAPSVRSAAQRHTHFLDGPRMAAVLARSDFTFRDLADASASVFLVLPPNRLATHARWLRLLVAEALHALTEAGPSRGGKVLLLLDEFAALGRLDPVLQAVGLLAGYGVQIWIFLQDLSQLRSLYGRSAGTFLSNAGVLQVFNVSEPETAEYVARTLGAATAAYETRGSSGPVLGGPFRKTRSRSDHLARRELLTPDEIMRLPGDRQILLRPGQRPLLARKIRYFEDPSFAGLHDPPT